MSPDLAIQNQNARWRAPEGVGIQHADAAFCSDLIVQRGAQLAALFATDPKDPTKKIDPHTWPIQFSPCGGAGGIEAHMRRGDPRGGVTSIFVRAYGQWYDVRVVTKSGLNSNEAARRFSETQNSEQT